MVSNEGALQQEKLDTISIDQTELALILASKLVKKVYQDKRANGLLQEFTTTKSLDEIDNFVQKLGPGIDSRRFLNNPNLYVGKLFTQYFLQQDTCIARLDVFLLSNCPGYKFISIRAEKGPISRYIALLIKLQANFATLKIQR